MALQPFVYPIPDDPRPGVADPRVLGLWLDAQAHPRPQPSNLAEVRASMGWPNRDLSPLVATESTTLPGRSGSIPVRIYRSPGSSSALCPVVVYFHGGGFVGGSLGAVENQCRLLAQSAGAVVVNVDYRLAPEAPFPQGLEDCLDAVDAVFTQSSRWQIDPKRLVVAGDSAGGNLAAACCVLDRQRSRSVIAAQLLIYPVVDLRDEGQGHYPWTVSDYQIADDHRDLISAAVQGLRGASSYFNSHYLQGKSAQDPLASPILANPAAFPPTLVITAEYDFLRVEGEGFAAQLAEAGVPVRLVRFAGMEHSFFDKLGLHPQTSQAVAEMANFVRTWVQTSDQQAAVQQRIDFLAEIDKLKLVIRRNELADASRRENTAEHSWHLVMFALTLADYAAPGTNLGHAIELCAVHDLVEIDAGDTFFWDEKGYQDKEARERAGARRLFGLLPQDQSEKFLGWWEEFEACQTPESLYANAVDRLCPVLLNSRSGGRSWKEHGITATQVRGKMTNIALASPVLGQVLESLITAAQAKGILAP